VGAKREQQINRFRFPTPALSGSGSEGLILSLCSPSVFDNINFEN